MRDWRVVSIPEEAIPTYFACIPVFASIATMHWSHSALRLNQGMLLIGRAQNAMDFQDVLLNVCVADAVSLFGVYIKFIIMLEDDLSSPQVPCNSSRNAFEGR